MPKNNIIIPEIGKLYVFREDKRYFAGYGRSIFPYDNTVIDQLEQASPSWLNSSTAIGTINDNDVFMLLEIFETSFHRDPQDPTDKRFVARILTAEGFTAQCNLYSCEIKEEAP